jgi:hypothetical protein
LPSDTETAPSQGGYTDYGIALNLSFSDPEPASSTQSFSDPDEPAGFDHGDWQAPSMGSTSDAFHADDAVLRIAGDTLA